MVNNDKRFISFEFFLPLHAFNAEFKTPKARAIAFQLANLPGSYTGFPKLPGRFKCDSPTPKALDSPLVYV
jgi:hypothetical protein